jgi:hypothetical protein
MGKKILPEEEIRILQNNWYKSNHNRTNPKGYYDSPRFLSYEKQKIAEKQRVLDLIGLIKILYKWDINNPELISSGTNNDKDAYYKYILYDIIKVFPFRENENLLLDAIPDLYFKNWVENIFKMEGKRVNWKPITKNYPILDNENLNNFLKIRFERFLMLAEICHYIDKIQVDDYCKNKIIIDNQGRFINGKIEELTYGMKHGLSAFLGQFIVRKFPFKDYYGFYSTEYIKKKGEMVYEHFTPMSFFRDLIWVKNLGLNPNSNLFIFDTEFSKPLSLEKWLSILWHLYRTVNICSEENARLDRGGFKMRRPYNTYSKKDILIEINDSNKIFWDQIHSISNLAITYNANLNK